MQQQPLGTPSDPAAAELLRAAQAAAVAQAELASTPAAEFLGLLIGIINRPQEPPTHLAVVVDVPGATYRRLKYPQYKSQRPEHPPQLTAELSAALSVVDALSIPVLAVPGVEADDVIGTLASKAAGAGFEVVIVSTDKDFYQLLGPRVSVLSRPPRGPLYRPSDFQQQYGLPDPRLIIDLKALAGDPADNIPGVRGVGDKSARALVGAWGPLEGIFGALDDLGREQSQAVVKLRKPALEMLHSAEGRAAARFAKQLVTINTALKAPPLREPWESYELRLPPDGGALAQERALKLRMGWVCARLHDLLQRWAATGSSSSSSNGRSVQQAPGVVR